MERWLPLLASPRGLACLALALCGCGAGPTSLASGPPTEAPAAQAASALARADAEAFAGRDADADGRLAPAEVADLPGAGFRALDADGDGFLSRAEAFAQAGAPARRQADAAAVLAGQRGETVAAAPGVRTAGRPVVMVPGYLDARFYFTLVRRRIEAGGRSAHYLDLFPNICDITLSAERLRARVEQVKAETGARQVDLVAHSEGGLIARHYIRFLGGEASVGRLVTLATPHHGTIVAYLGPGTGADQMQPGSAFLKALNADDESFGGVEYTSIRGSLDEIILPHGSMIQEGAINHEVKRIEHATILTSGAAWALADAGLRR